VGDESARGANSIPEPLLLEVARSLSIVLSELHALVPDHEGDRLKDRVAGHLGMEATRLPIVSHEFPPYQLVDVQVALEEWVARGERRAIELTGVSGDQRRFPDE
jgi:hypothetical protein